jgi:hypothetical protein
VDSPNDTAAVPGYPGFLQTLRGLYITHADFLGFIRRAAEKEGIRGDDPARAWLARRGLPTDPDRLTRAQVSLALFEAQKIIAPQVAQEMARAARNGNHRS